VFVNGSIVMWLLNEKALYMQHSIGTELQDVNMQPVEQVFVVGGIGELPHFRVRQPLRALEGQRKEDTLMWTLKSCIS
jgi:hypothetical protein